MGKSTYSYNYGKSLVWSDLKTFLIEKKLAGVPKTEIVSQLL